MNKLFTTLLLSLALASASAQIVATTNNNGNQLSQILAGNGVIISNVTMNCPNGAAGTFNCVNCNLGMQQGIVLTTGSDTAVSGPNDSGAEGTDLFSPGDPSLNSLAQATTYDACALEFDMNVLSDSVEFRYIFASEEYLEWVNSGYNDAFAFFISGPGIAGQQNIAVIPNTTIPVTIDNLNTNLYSQYYVDNGDGYTTPYSNNNSYIQYDGFTRVLTAKKKGLQPCQTYHLKLVIADGGDGIYDSGVFLEANSLTSNFVSVDTAETNVPNVTNAMEGCVEGIINFRLQTPISQPTVVHYQIGGTAVNGTDYSHIADSLIIPAGDTVVALHIHPVADGLVEGTETVVVRLFAACSNAPYDSATLLIIDSFGVNAGPDATICSGDQTQLHATGLGTFTWTPNNGSISNNTLLAPYVSPTATTTYTINANLGVCQSSDQVTITTISAPFTVNAGPDVSSCSAGSIQLNAVVTGNPVNGNPFVYSWSPANGLSAVNIANPTANPASSTNYAIAVSSGNCTARDTVSVTLGSITASTSSTPETCGSHNGTATVTTNGASPSYAWSNGGQTQTITGVIAGVYTVTVNAAGGCSATAAVSVSSTGSMSATATATDETCLGSNNGTATANAAGSSLTYIWSNGGQTQTINGLAGGSYSVTVSDNGGCSATASVIVAPGILMSASATSTNETCFGYLDGTATATGNGNAPYTYEWTNGANVQTPGNLAGGIYTVTVTDNGGCTATATTTVASTNPIVFGNPTIADVKCFGGNDGSLDVTATGGAGTINFVWASGTTGAHAGNLSAGTPYTVSAVDANQCTAQTTYVLAIPAQMNVNIVPSDVSCNPGGTGTSITPNAGHDGGANASVVGGAAPFTYLWNTNDATASIANQVAGNYSVVATDANGCTASGTTTINEPLPMSITASSMAPLCSNATNGTIDASSIGGTPSYFFTLNFNGTAIQSNNLGAFTGLASGDYTISVSDANNCVKIAQLNLPNPIADEFNVATVATTCSNLTDGKIIITPVSILNQPYLYSIDGGGNQQLNEFYNVAPGSHRLHMINNNGCTTDTAVVVTAPVAATLEIVPGDTTIELGQTIQLNTVFSSFASDSPVVYSWSAAAGLSCTDCANPVVNSYDKVNDYTLTVTYNGHCTAVATAKVNVNGSPAPFVPNAFTPNGDGNNDIFMVYGEGIRSCDLKVFNRWGELVFASTNQYDGWDGTYKGQLQNTNVYVYEVTATYLDGRKVDSKGTITLIR